MISEYKFLDNLLEILELYRLSGKKNLEISDENRKFIAEYLLFNPKGISPATKPNEVNASYQPGKIEHSPSELISHDESKDEVNRHAIRDMNHSDSTPTRFQASRKTSPPGTLKDLQEMANACTNCNLCKNRTKTIPDSNTTTARVMFVGDSPSGKNDSLGDLFGGKIGELLLNIIKAMKLNSSQVYLANVTKCPPPDNQKPTMQEIEKCFPFLYREIELVNPEVLVLLGPIPLKALLNKSGISENRGKWFEYRNIQCLATFHPSYLLRVPRAKREVWSDMQLVMKKLNISSNEPG